ncbi:proton-conducting transporter transmembrane domain-containing protein [Wolbachia endosymbiont of Dirofilaria (Dirofilaria) immitis]|uniref:proton-conducting transporter transmembrane domain-containing protein n=1 Tax=Wolbachia endosymbiont of Dirofilaria (Dirofilaria) immitis TaxID=1812115 RepID=UPI00158E2C27|nr:proton-conducting transporter membrane subunit [Wolbachia endosymbiont of Dirofilaria (Dirofilaria) immitis]QKX02608.1 cation:proton antiporter [Wolbachia endosymbiont of Dirofilaria (Dirofilaria) immitis]
MDYVLMSLSLPFFITENYLLITALIPLFGAVIIFFTGKWPMINNSITVISSMFLFTYTCLCTLYWIYSDHSQFILIDFGNNLHISLKLESTGVIFSLLISFLWILTSIYAVCYMKSNYPGSNYSSFLCFFSVSISCVMFIAFSGDLLATFVFYELLTISTYPLITYSATNESIIAGRYYFGMLFFSSLILFFPALGLLYSEFHTLDFVSDGVFKFDTSLITFTTVCFTMLIYGIGKAALMPMHFWLPKAMVAPTPVSALLHAVAVVKSGAFIIIKVIFCIFGIGNLQLFAQQNWFIGGWLPYVAGFTIITASLIALKQKELKKLLAYSTVSQLSYITLSASILSDLSAKVAVFQLVCHAFAKITLFFVAGSIVTETGEKYVDRIHGIGRSMPITMVAFTVGALSMIGVPPAPTFWGKFFIFQAVFNSGNVSLIVFITLLLIISTVLNAMCFLPIIYNAFFLKPSRRFFIKKTPIFLVLPPVITAICTFIIFFSYQIIF